MISFKYRAGAAALRCLSDGALYFASPAELNDSLEAKFNLVNSKQFIDTLTKVLGEIASHREQPGGYSFDMSGLTEFEKANKLEGTRFLDASQKVGIFSTATRPDNQPMWAYYCDNLRGVCFELEWTTEVCEKYQLWPSVVCYTTKSRIHNRADDLSQAFIEVALQHPDWTMEQLLEYSLSEPFRRGWGVRSMARAVSIKHADWQHEAEVRLLAPQAGPLPILANVLKRVYFTRTDFSEWGPILMLLYRLYPKVEIAHLSFEHTEPFVRVQLLEAKLIPIRNKDDLWAKRL
jgi:hypothetical protein